MHAQLVATQHADADRDREVERAAMALRMGQPAAAEQFAAAVLKANRGHVGAAVMLAQALIAQGKTADAIEPLQRAAKRSQDARVEISTEDDQNFRKNLVTILAEERLALAVYNTLAFVKGDFSDQVTDLTS